MERNEYSSRIHKLPNKMRVRIVQADEKAIWHPKNHLLVINVDGLNQTPFWVAKNQFLAAAKSNTKETPKSMDITLWDDWRND